MKPRWILPAALSACLGGASPADARVSVVAATQELAGMTRAIGGNQVAVDYLCSSNQDPHRVEPRPSQVVKISQAGMVVRVGLDLDLWFDSLIRAAGNGRIAPGGKGYVDCSRGIRLLEIPVGKLDPSKGDIHIYGNPHYWFGPSNMKIVARNIADGLKRVDPGNAKLYDDSTNALVKRIDGALKGWRDRLNPHRGKSVVTYHKSHVYFLNEFGLREFGNVEPKPGLEPTPSHVRNLAGSMKQAGVKVIVCENWRPRRFADLLARESGGAVVVIPGGSGSEKGIDDYFQLMDALVDRIARAL